MNGPFLAILLLGPTGPLSPDALKTRLRTQCKGYVEKIDVVASSGRRGFVVTLGSELFTVMMADMPVLVGTLDRAVNGNLLWPNAEVILANHCAHVVVGNLNSGADIKSRVAAANALTLLCAAIAGVLPCLGIYWAASENVCQPTTLTNEAADICKGKLPLSIWVRLHFFRGESQDEPTPVGCVTMGLSAIVGRELEFESVSKPVAEIAQHVLAASQYLINNGLVIRHGGTFALGAAERIRVEHLERGKRISAPVLRLTWGSAAPAPV